MSKPTLFQAPLDDATARQIVALRRVWRISNTDLLAAAIAALTDHWANREPPFPVQEPKRKAG